MKKEARLQGILHISQIPHISGSPLKEPSLKVPFMESSETDASFPCPSGSPESSPLIELQKIIKFSGMSPPPTYQVPHGWKGASMERDARNRTLS